MGPLVRLPVRHDLELEPTPPFAFDPSFHKPDNFPSADKAWEPGVRWQTMRWRERLLGLRFEDAGRRIRLTVWAEDELDPRFLADLAAELAYRSNLGLDLGEFERRLGDDAVLGPVIARWRGMRPLHLSSLYEYLVIAVVLQNTVVRRSVAMLQALFERYGTRLAFDGRELHAFWPPETLASAPEQDLRALKVGYRARTLARVSEGLASGAVDEPTLRAATLEEQRDELLALYGIGPASVDYILADVFHRFDELSHISPWEQKIYSRLLFGTPIDAPVPVERLLRRVGRWAPYRGLAIHYLWEDLFWRHEHEGVDWLVPLIRL